MSAQPLLQSPKLTAQPLPAKLPEHDPFSVVVAASRLGCAHQEEHNFFTQTLKNATTDPRTFLLAQATGIYKRRAKIVPHLLPAASLVIDAHLVAYNYLLTHDKNDADFLYDAGMAPDQMDSRDIPGYYASSLSFSQFIMRVLVGGTKVEFASTAGLISKGANPSTKRVRYVGDAVPKSIEESTLIGNILTTVIHGGLPGATQIASVDFRLAFWANPVKLAEAIVNAHQKRGILLAVYEFLCRLPCSIVSSLIRKPVGIPSIRKTVLLQHAHPFKPSKTLGSTPALLKFVQYPKQAVRSGTRALSTLVGRFGSQERARDAYLKFSMPFGTRVPESLTEMEMLRATTERMTSMSVIECHTSVAEDQITRFGPPLISVCISCMSVLSANSDIGGKSNRVSTVCTPFGNVCSGCDSSAVVTLDLTGRILSTTLGKKTRHIAACSECGVATLVAGFKGVAPVCSKHNKATVFDIENYCVVCSKGVYMGRELITIEVEDRLVKVCESCFSALPTERWTTTELLALQKNVVRN